LINHFKVESSPEKPNSGHDIPLQYAWFLVDLPGYGYAKLSKTARSGFDEMIRNYLLKRETLALTFLLIDSRLEPQRNDLEFMNWMGDQEISFIVIFTKCDKLSVSQLQQNMENYKHELAMYWAETPMIIPASSSTNRGKGEILETIHNALREIS
jgi:GTP-binding protein